MDGLRGSSKEGHLGLDPGSRLSCRSAPALPTVNKLIAATSAPPPAPAPGAAPPSGPPPHVAALVKRGRQIGMIQAVLIVVIVFLMVTKPF